jgi:hypothetical protein
VHVEHVAFPRETTLLDETRCIHHLVHAVQKGKLPNLLGLMPVVLENHELQCDPWEVRSLTPLLDFEGSKVGQHQG